jgi:hypothetical protein
MKQMKKISILLIFVLAVSLCGAFPSEVLAAKALKGTLSGSVVDQNGKPVSNTQVYIYQRDWSNTDGLGTPDWKDLVGTTLSSRNGQYKISLPAGEYRVLFVPADLNKYSMEAYPNAPIPRLGDSVTIQYGRTTSNISVKLDPSGKIGGYIYDTDPDRIGEPMANVPIGLYHQELSYLNGIQFTSTDANGYYEFKGIKPYPWMAWVNTPFTCGVGMTAPDPTELYLNGYKDYFVSLMGQYTWEPMGGTTATANDIRLEYNDFPNIEGQISYFDETAHDFLPAAGVTVTAQFADNPMDIQDWGSEYLQTVSDANGYFTIRGFAQPYGIFILRVNGMDSNQQFYFDEYYDNAQDEWGAQQFEIVQGTQTDVGYWILEPLDPGEW